MPASPKKMRSQSQRLDSAQPMVLHVKLLRPLATHEPISKRVRFENVPRRIQDETESPVMNVMEVEECTEHQDSGTCNGRLLSQVVNSFE